MKIHVDELVCLDDGPGRARIGAEAAEAAEAAEEGGAVCYWSFFWPLQLPVKAAEAAEEGGAV